MEFRSLPGLTDYKTARALQLEMVDQRARDEIPDTLLLLEHTPVITRGRGLQRAPGQDPSRMVRQMPVPANLPEGISFSETERGGDLTYHGPGQLVVYPIFKLDGKGFGPSHDVTGFLRKLEKLFIDELTSLGLNEVHAQENATGVWVGGRKVASIGIAVRKWVTYHGLAINVVNDLSSFHLISPCGFSPEVMTRLSDLLPEDAFPREDWRAWLEERLIQRFKQSLES